MKYRSLIVIVMALATTCRADLYRLQITAGATAVDPSLAQHFPLDDGSGDNHAVVIVTAIIDGDAMDRFANNNLGDFECILSSEYTLTLSHNRSVFVRLRRSYERDHVSVFRTVAEVRGLAFPAATLEYGGFEPDGELVPFYGEWRGNGTGQALPTDELLPALQAIAAGYFPQMELFGWLNPDEPLQAFAATSRAYTVSLEPYDCPSDFNDDAFVNTLDVLEFLNAWRAQDPNADINHDGYIDSRDIAAFLNLWVAGCS